MNLENQVCTLAQAKCLKEFGVRCYPLTSFACLFFWSDNGAPGHPRYEIAYAEYQQRRGDVEVPFYPAFTASELGLMNGETITINYAQWANPAAALADHLIGRLDRKEITASEVNDRLNAA